MTEQRAPSADRLAAIAAAAWIIAFWCLALVPVRTEVLVYCPEDWLVIVRGGSSAPELTRLEWHFPFRDMWIGRLPRGAKQGAQNESEATPAALEPSRSAPAPTRR